jgi:glycosyltransferase involved in cell wall biosynthesis
MNIVMLSDLETAGGAAISASRLATALCTNGHQITRIVKVRDGHSHPWKTRTLSTISSSLLFKQSGKILSHGWREKLFMGIAKLRLQNLLQKIRPDVINVHNLHFARWAPDLIEVCRDQAPVVWTLHDMWSFTGRCPYSYDCRKFLTGCDASCPTPHEYPALDPEFIAEAWKNRRKIFSNDTALVAVTPSRWLAGEAQLGLWAGHRVEVITNGIPLNVYFPIDRGEARKKLGIPMQGTILMAAADDLDDRRKGFGILLGALRLMRRRPLTIMLMGSGRRPDPIEGIDFRPLGHISDEAHKVLLYNAVNLLLHPSPVDNLPNTVVESISCGTPVIGFDTGGVSELIQTNQTGWLCSEVSPASLAASLEKAVDEIVSGVDFRDSCRAFAEQKFPADLQGRRYEDLFRELASGSRPVGSS